MKQLLRLILVISLIIANLGCFNVGLPEYYSSASAKKLKVNRTALILIDATRVYDTTSRDYHGNQYLFPFLPFTSLYHQYGRESLILELIIDQIRQKGFYPVVADKSRASTAQRIAAADIVLEPKIDDLEINAFDLLLFRKLSVSGDLRINYFKTDFNRPFYYNSFNFSESKIRSFASAQGLGFFLEKVFSEAFDKQFEKDLKKQILISTRAKKKASNQKQQKTFVLIPTQVSEEVYQNFEPILRNSYGFSDMPAFSIFQVQRLIQRGFEQSLADKSFISYLDRINKLANFRNVWLVSTRLNSVREQNRNLDFNMSILISGQNSNEINLNCSYQARIDKSNDAYVAVATMMAMKEMLNSAIRNTGERCYAI